MCDPRRKENTENEKQERERVTLRDLRLGRETSIRKGKKKSHARSDITFALT